MLQRRQAQQPCVASSCHETPGKRKTHGWGCFQPIQSLEKITDCFLFRFWGIPRNTLLRSPHNMQSPRQLYAYASLVAPPWSWTSNAVWQVKSPWATSSHPPQRRSVSARARDPKNPPWLQAEGPASSWFEPVSLGSLPNSCFLQKRNLHKWRVLIHLSPLNPQKQNLGKSKQQLFLNAASKASKRSNHLSHSAMAFWHTRI